MVNSSVYIFGNLSNGYAQYPDNYAKKIFQEFYHQASAKSQIAIHRDDNLMYYGYIRKLDENSQYIGFCVVLNGVMLSKIRKLFPLFEDAVEKMVLKGDIIGFDDKAKIVTKVSAFTDKPQEISRVVSMIRQGIDDLRTQMKALPPVDYSISNRERKVFDVSEPSKNITDASVKYGYTYIMKGDGCNTSSLSGYQEVLENLSKQNIEYSQKLRELTNKYNKLNQQKKQYRNIIVLCLILVACGIGLYFLNGNLESTKETLGQTQWENIKKEKTIKQQNDTIGSLQANVSHLETSLSSEQTKRIEAEKKLSALSDACSNLQPIIIKSTSFNFTTGQLSFDYFGFVDRTITLSVKAYGNGMNYSNSTSFYVQKGLHSSSIYVSDALYPNVYYSFELLIGGKIIGGGIH